jgi:hypothetical protein
MSQNAVVIDKMLSSIMEDSRLTVREIAHEVGITRGSANTILTDDLGMRRVAEKFAPSYFHRSSNNSNLTSRRTRLSPPTRILSS